MRKTLFLVFLSLLANLCFGQMLPISDSELISSSENIIQGVVLSSKSLWVNNNKYIYTFTKVKVNKIFSGRYHLGDTVTVVTPGGYDPIKDVGMGVSSQATFDSGEEAVLFLVIAKGEMDAIDYSFLKDEPSVPSNIMRVNGYYQGKHRIIRDKKLGKMFVFKSNENRLIDLNENQLNLKREIKQLNRIKAK